MRETALLKLALTASVIGIMGLFFLAETVEMDAIAISRLDGAGDGRVKVAGEVVRVSARGNATFLTIAAREEARVVIFGKARELRAGDSVSITGQVAEHDGEREIIADKVVLFDAGPSGTREPASGNMSEDFRKI